MRRVDEPLRQTLKSLPDGLVVLRFKEISDELRIFKDVVNEKITPISLNRIDILLRSMDQLAKAAPGQSLVWSTEGGAIETIPNEGNHQVGRCGHGRSLSGKLEFKWMIEPCGLPNRRQPLARPFALRNSSIRIAFRDLSLGISVACWDFDIGDHQSPGCHVHAKFAPIQQEERAALSDVDVPRLPSIILTPMDAIDFMVGELWQEEWLRISAGTSVELKAWRQYPKRRLLKLLEWYLGEVRDAQGAPWNHLKRAKPDRFLLWGE